LIAVQRPLESSWREQAGQVLRCAMFWSIKVLNLRTPCPFSDIQTLSALKPRLSSMRTLGLANFNVDTSFGLFAPAGIPAGATQRLNQALTAALASADVKAKFAPMLAEPAPMTSEQFGTFVKAEPAKYRDVVKSSGAKVD